MSRLDRTTSNEHFEATTLISFVEQSRILNVAQRKRSTSAMFFQRSELSANIRNSDNRVNNWTF